LGPIKGGHSRGRWEDNIKMGVKDIEYEDVDWIHLVWDRTSLANTVFELQDSVKRAGNFLAK
jgi:hypothetical protein